MCRNFRSFECTGTHMMFLASTDLLIQSRDKSIVSPTLKMPIHSWSSYTKSKYGKYLNNLYEYEYKKVDGQSTIHSVAGNRASSPDQTLV